jgi:DNA polymerase elongation subunit (family B)
LLDLPSVITDTLKQIDKLIKTSGDLQLKGVHVDVTSMYPSQIRQYKLQPSGIVPLTKCEGCEYAEKDSSCYFTGEWVIKITARRSCRHRIEGSGKCDPSICTTQHQSSCSEYEPEQVTSGRIQEVYAFNGQRSQAYSFGKKGGLTKIPFSRSYLGKNNGSENLYENVSEWLHNSVDATQISNQLDNNHFDIFDDQPDGFRLPSNTFLSLDVRTKKITVLLSVQSRVCQKAFNFVARIMDDFFNTRVQHKKEAQRLKALIKQKTSQNQAVSAEMYRQQKFHDSTQLGMKVPLNSIYGLLGMKAGVRNASMPCAGITTKLSADLIYWAANQLEKIGVVTELDSLDYEERLILKDPEGFVEIISIGEFHDQCISLNGIESLDILRGVDYVTVQDGWLAISVSKDGFSEWKSISKCIRQKTTRNLIKVTTPFGSVKTTESHSLFQLKDNRITPIEVRNLTKEFVSHICRLPKVEKSSLYIDFTKFCLEDLDLFIYIPVNNTLNPGYHISHLRYDKNSKEKRRKFYRIPLNKFDDEINSKMLIGSQKGYKYPARLEINNVIAELCGWFVAEGSSGIYEGKVSVGISQQDKTNLKRIQWLIEDVAKNLHTPFKIKPALSDSRSKTYRLAMDNIFFYHLFKALGCGHNAFNKRIPKLILSASKVIKESFMSGYFKGDGTFHGKRQIFWTSSGGLRDDLYVLGKQLDYIVSIQETVSSTSGNPCYIINFMEKGNWMEGSKPHYDYRELNETLNLQVKTKKNVNKSSEYVFDLSVADNNNFVSANGGIVCHNTDGIWLWVPRQFPLDFPVTISNNGNSQKIRVSIIDKILNERVIKAGFKNDNYWMNDGKQIKKSSKSLIQFEQDGPYDLQFVMGKKKYIVYNFNESEERWEEKEITGLESKRADFSKLQKHFQEEIIQSYLKDFNLNNPISLADIYQNAMKASDNIKEEILQGKLDPSYFVKPKAINKRLSEYKSKLPQVTAAYILQDLGFSVDPGIRIQMVNIIGNHVIPFQIFDFDFGTVKRVFIKHGICTLSFMLNELSTMDDIRKLIDTKQYLSDIYGPGRIFDRMIQFPMKRQQLMTDTQPKLSIKAIRDEIVPIKIPNNEQMETDKEFHPKQREKGFNEKPKPIPVRIIQKSKISKKRKKSSKQSRFQTQSLDTIFNFPIETKKSIKSSSEAEQHKLEQIVLGPDDKPSKKPTKVSKFDQKSKTNITLNNKEAIDPITLEEVEEIEEEVTYSNGQSIQENTVDLENENETKGVIVCIMCGAIVNTDELIEGGCLYCKDHSAP